MCSGATVSYTHLGIGFVIFGIHRQHHADGLQGFAVALELSVHLAFRHFGANGNACLLYTSRCV